MSISDNVNEIVNHVDAAVAASTYSHKKTEIIAVTKYVDADVARNVFDSGQITHIAENRVDLFLDKQEKLADLDLTWHLIGNLQRRKVKDVINKVDYFHALDNVKLAAEIDKRAEHIIKCFLEINVSGEESKHGFANSELDNVLAELVKFDKVEIVGLMTMAPFDANDNQLDEIFGQLKKLQVEIAAKNLKNVPCTELSMGMSRDYQKAIEHGATFVRIGSDFFKK